MCLSEEFVSRCSSDHSEAMQEQVGQECGGTNTVLPVPLLPSVLISNRLRLIHDSKLDRPEDSVYPGEYEYPAANPSMEKIEILVRDSSYE